MMAARRTFWTNVTILTASLTLLGGLFSSVIALFGSAQATQNEVERGVCKMVYDALGDDKPNPHVNREEAKQFVAAQLRLAQKCGQRIE